MGKAQGAIFGAFLVSIGMAGMPAEAENLNVKYGPSWTCSNIDAPQNQLQEACKACEAKADDFFQDSDTSGHCVAVDSEELVRRGREKSGSAPAAALTPPAAPDIPPAENRPHRWWGALAGAVWKVHGSVRAAVGSAVKYQSEAEAKGDALAQCRKAGGLGCEIATSWNTGCGYITTGQNDRGAGWSKSTSVEKTLDNCRSKGYVCKEPIGGCVD